MTSAAPSPEAALWRARSDDAWAALARRAFLGCRGRRVVREPRGLRAVPLWPFSQVLHAASAVDAVESPALLRTLESYRRGTAYAERPRGRRRYFDDNAWVGLGLLAHGDAGGAARLLGFLREGCVTIAGGEVGVRWVEGGDALHACSTGSTGLVASRLAASADPGTSEDLVRLARGCAAFLEGLVGADGLVADSRRPDGSVDPAVYSYNQALLVGLRTDLGRHDDAVDLATRVVSVFDDDRLWAHPPAFNAILVRELLLLDAVRPDAGLREWCRAYLTRVWAEARDLSTGLFTGGGIGRYDDGVVLDHAALTGSMAALASAGAQGRRHPPR